MISSLPHLTVRRGVQSRFASSSRRKHTEYYTSSILSVSVDSPLSRPTERPASTDSSCDLLWPPTLTVTLYSTPGLPAPTPYTNAQTARLTGTHTAAHAVPAPGFLRLPVSLRAIPRTILLNPVEPTTVKARRMYSRIPRVVILQWPAKKEDMRNYPPCDVPLSETFTYISCTEQQKHLCMCE